MTRKSYAELREEAINNASSKGIEILENSSTATAFAADTSNYGLDLREDLQEIATDGIESEAARFIDYEVTELARRAGVYAMDTDEEKYSLSAELVHGETPLEELYRALILVDRIQRGYTDKRTEEKFNGENQVRPERYPNPLDLNSMAEYQAAAMEESGITDPKNIGYMNQDEIFVVNDDWISYRGGEEPPGIDAEIRSEVEGFLRDLGVGR